MKICSGAQTGADIAGLIAAKKFGLQTLGWMPVNFMTEQGPKPHWAQEFNLKETKSIGNMGANYNARTENNVRDSTATIRFATDFNSRGEQCTLRAIKKFNKPYLDIDVNNPLPAKQVVEWLIENKVGILNIAGNRESKSPGIGRFVVDFLSDVFLEMGLKAV